MAADQVSQHNIGGRPCFDLVHLGVRPAYFEADPGIGPSEPGQPSHLACLRVEGTFY